MMDRKVKGALILGVMLVAVASALYIVPALAQMNGNGDCDGACDGEPDRLRERDRDCSCICLQEQNQTQSQTQNQTRTRACW